MFMPFTHVLKFTANTDFEFSLSEKKYYMVFEGFTMDHNIYTTYRV